MDTHILENILKEHEGFNQFGYQDSLGWLTIGYGRCIDQKKGPGISQEEALYLLKNDINNAAISLQNYSWYSQLDDVRKCAIVELVFNMGLRNWLGFKNTISLLSSKDYKGASEELLKSRWASQVGQNRSNNIAYRIKNGAYPS